MSAVALAVNNLALRATMISTAAIALKYYVTVGIQGAARVPAGSRPPEDKALFPKAGTQDFSGTAKSTEFKDDKKAKYYKEREQRWLRIVSNDLENLPIGLVVGWGTLLCAYSPYVHAAAISLFAIARIAHTVSYANQLQPHRAICWMLGVLSIFIMVGNGAAGALLLFK